MFRLTPQSYLAVGAGDSAKQASVASSKREPLGELPRISRTKFLGFSNENDPIFRNLSRAHPPLAEILNNGTFCSFNSLDQAQISSTKDILRMTEQVGSLSVTYNNQCYEFPLVFDISNGAKQIKDKKHPDFSFLRDTNSLLNSMEVGVESLPQVQNDLGIFVDHYNNREIDCTEYGHTIPLVDINELKEQILNCSGSIEAITCATEIALQRFLDGRNYN